MSNVTHWSNEIRARAQGVSHDRLWIEKVKLLTQPERIEVETALDDGPMAELRSLFDEFRALIERH